MAELWRVDHASLTEALGVRPSQVNKSLLESTLDSNRHSGGWYGPECATAEQAQALYAKGWTEGAHRISSIKAESLSMPRSIRRRRTWTDHGDSVDIHRVYAGRIDKAWQKPVRQSRVATRSVTIVAPLNISCGHRSEQMYWRGAAIARLSDLLSEAGYNVAVVGVIALTGVSWEGETNMLHTIPLKDPNQPLDICNLAAGLAHSGFFRSVGFRLIASYAKRISSSFGRNPVDRVNAMVRKLGEEYEAAGDLVMVAPYDIFEERRCQAWLDEQVTRINQLTE